MKKYKSRVWIAMWQVLLVLLISTTASDNEIEITTSDPTKINVETNAYVTSLMDQTHGSEPIVLRVDKITDALVDHATANIASEQDRITFVMNGMGFTNIWDDVIFDPEKGLDLSLFAAALLGLLPGDFGIEPHPNFLKSQQAAVQAQQLRNFTAETLQAYSDVMRFLGDDMNTPTPFYQLSYGYEKATNAKTKGFFIINSIVRCFVYFNLGARDMLQPGYFRSALVHETWHCVQFYVIAKANDNEAADHDSVQQFQKSDVLQASLQEGVVIYLTALVSPELSDAELLFWTAEELAAANARITEVIQAFEEDRNKTDLDELRQWMFLDVPLTSVPGAPSRCGYYVAYLAVQAYARQLDDGLISSPTMLARHLLPVTRTYQGREDVFQALLKGEGPGSSLQQQSSSRSLFLSCRILWYLVVTVWSVLR